MELRWENLGRAKSHRRAGPSGLVGIPDFENSPNHSPSARARSACPIPELASSRFGPKSFSVQIWNRHRPKFPHRSTEFFDMAIFKTPKTRKLSHATRKKLSKKTKQIATALKLDKWYIREVFLAVSRETKQKRFLYSISDEVVRESIRSVTQVFRNPAFQKAVKNRTALRRVAEFCTLKRSVAPPPHPILINPMVKVSKVGCGKGASQLYMTEM
jgi:hypothetical protein